MAYTDFSLTRDRPPCGSCPNCAGGCKVRASCLKWVDWEKRKAQRYDLSLQARSAQVEEFGIARDVFRRAMVRKAMGR